MRFDHAQSAILQSVDVRSKDRLKFLTNTLQTRKQQEIDDIGAVLDELEKAIQSELKKDQQPEQMSLFTEDERTQLRRDTAALEAHPDRVRALVRAVRRGWQAYLADPGPANGIMHALNPTMAAETFAEAALIQQPLIQGQLDDGSLGTMTLERWRTLAEQLHGLGLIDRVEPERAFVNP